MKAIDPLKYVLHPVWMTPDRKWMTGSALFDQKFFSKPDFSKLTPFSPGQFPFEVDVALLCFHGQFGEDGAVQGLLEMLSIPYTGSGVAASSIAMNKWLSKELLRGLGIPVTRGILVKKGEVIENFGAAIDRVINVLPFPLFVKPNNLGSSIGVGRAESREELERALAGVFKYDKEALIEELVSPLLEVNISVIEGEPPRASVVEIPVAQDGKTLTFEDKYKRGKNKGASGGMASLTRVIDPPDLDEGIKREVTRWALQAFSALSLGGVVRFDFLLNTKTGALFFNELNPIPGSLAFYLWEKSTPVLLYPAIIDCLIEGAKRRFSERLSCDARAFS